MTLARGARIWEDMMKTVAFRLVSYDWAVTTGRLHGLENVAWQRDQCQQRDRTEKYDVLR